MGGIIRRVATRYAAGTGARIALPALALLLLIVGFLGYATSSDEDHGAPSRAASGARDGGFQVGALGRIEPEGEVIDIGGPADERLASVLVREGDQVTRDQVLGYLSSHEQRSAEVKVAEAALHQAEVRVQRTKELYPLLIRSQEARIRSIEVELANNQDILKSHMESREFQSRRAVDDQSALVRQNEENLRSERENLDRLKVEMHLETLSEAAALEQAEADLARARARAREVVVVAPIDGQVLKILTRVGGRVGDQPILKMGNTREMHAVAEVYETDISRVRIGQRAVVTSPALSTPLHGGVVQIGRMIFKNDVLGTDPAARIDARVVEVRILLDDSEAAAALTHLSVDVIIQVDDANAVSQARTAGGP